MARRVLVTGASGLIGQHVCARLTEDGNDVIGVSRRPLDRADLSDSATTDLLDPAAHRSLLDSAKPDTVIHLAWQTEDRMRSARNVDHLRSSVALLAACAEAKVPRVVTTGTGIEYAAVDQPRHERETPCTPETPYGAAKLALGTTLDSFVAADFFSGAHARIFYTFGPGEEPPRLVAYVMSELLAGRRPAVSAGTQRCDYLVLDDVAGAICAIALGEVDGPVNVASGIAHPVRDIVIAAASAVGATADEVDFGAVDPNLPEQPTIVADIDRLTTEVGYVADFTLTDALAHTARWYREHTEEPQP